MTVDSLKRVSVPVPPMQVQMEVVQLLYKFTELSESLKAELVARQKQYEYYRSRLLTFDVRRGGQLNSSGRHSAKSRILVLVIAIRTRRWKMANIRFLFVLRSHCEKIIMSMMKQQS